ncbi:MAG: type IV secretory system conjugative DNA transfer family protein [Ruminococcus sp.]|nr:type IV secretory system conjugative DNA transfer family protein [Ruminococcus sp.]
MEKDNVILGEGCIYSTDSSVTGINNNIIVCGGSGSGKTMSISEPRILETYNGSLIITVTKRRIVDKYKSMFIKRGYEVETINFVNPNKGSIGYDPLEYMKCNQDITFLADSIVNAGSNAVTSKDPYWSNAAASLLSAEIAYVLQKSERPCFAEVLVMNDVLSFWEDEDSSSIITSLDKYFQELEEESPDCFAISCWKTFRCLPRTTAGCVFGTLNAVMDKMFSEDLRNVFYINKTIDFQRLSSRKTVLFIVTNPVNSAANSFINIFYSTAFKELFEYAESKRSGKLPVPVHVLCDDFATGGKINDFVNYISIFREKDISVTLLLQSETQLRSMYEENEAETIINNCDTYIYLGGMDLKTAENISRRLNAPLEDVLYMPIGQEIIFRRGQKPIITKRYDIKSNKVYQLVSKRFEGKSFEAS